MAQGLQCLTQKNGVRQGGVLSPILFCVYMDELFTRIRKSGYGFHVGHNNYAVFGYADDVKLFVLQLGGCKSYLKYVKRLLKNIM